MSRYFIHYSNFQGVTLFLPGRTGKSKLPDGKFVNTTDIDTPKYQFDTSDEAEAYAKYIFEKYGNVRVQVIDMDEKKVILVLENEKVLDQEAESYYSK